MAGSIASSPPANASATQRGLVSTLAQSFAGIKTFIAAVVMSAGLTINGVLAANTDLGLDIPLVFGTATSRATFGHGRAAAANFPNPTFSIFNTAGKAISISASNGNARVAFDNSAALVFSSVLRTDMEATDWLFNGTAVSRLTINGATGDVTVKGAGQLNTEAANTWTAAQRGGVTALTSSGASIAINLAATNNFSHTLTENTTLAAPSNPVAGQSGVIHFTQHASSPKTLAYSSFWKFPGGTIPTLTATNGATDVLVYQVLTSGMALCQLQKGIA